MRHDIDWENIQEKQPGEYVDIAPGGYVAMILHVKDVEEKEYLEIEWDFVNGDHQGANQETFDRAGFWPITLRRSYKTNALGFFKAFKTSVEMSNKNYTFSTRDVQGLVGKRMGVVLGKEEYRKNSGEVGERLYVYQIRSVKAIQDGDFKTPDLKKLKDQGSGRTENRQQHGYIPLVPYKDDDDDKFPF